MAPMVQPPGELLMDSLYFSLRFSPDWQGDDSIQTGLGWSGGFDHLFAANLRSTSRKSAM